MENGDFLEKELDIIIGNLDKYRQAIRSGDKEELTRLLEDGKRLKEEVDG